MKRSAALVCGLALAACAPHRDYSAYEQDSGVAPPADTGVETIVDTAPPYPDGPYGIKKNDVFPNIHFQGYRGGVGAWTDYWMSDYFDPDGSKGIDAIMMNVSAAWCPGCNELAKSLPSIDATFAPRGAHLMTDMTDEVDVTPATKKTVDVWLDKYALPFDTGIDPDQVWIKSTGDFAFPTQIYVDPRTMRVTRVDQGVSDVATVSHALETLLEANGSFPSDAGDAADAAAE